MKTADTLTLLVEYVEHKSECAFGELVNRYINLVYSTALRSVGGDKFAADDVTQTVFADLARKARTLSREPLLGGWLYQRTRYTASNLLRSERRRHAREREAAAMNTLEHESQNDFAGIASILDQALSQLTASDRNAILLRFFEQRDFRSIGEALGIQEDAARMRVNRALEKLHSFLQSRDVTLSAGALGTVLATEAVTAAPAGLAAITSAAALVSAGASSGILFPLAKAITLSKAQVGVGAALLLALTMTP